MVLDNSQLQFNSIGYTNNSSIQQTSFSSSTQSSNILYDSSLHFHSNSHHHNNLQQQQQLPKLTPAMDYSTNNSNMTSNTNSYIPVSGNSNTNFNSVESNQEGSLCSDQFDQTSSISSSNKKRRKPAPTIATGRRNLKSENVSPEEADRRDKRRERNRKSAQRCRERKIEKKETLQMQLNSLQRVCQSYLDIAERVVNAWRLRLKLLDDRLPGHQFESHISLDEFEHVIEMCQIKSQSNSNNTTGSNADQLSTGGSQISSDLASDSCTPQLSQIPQQQQQQLSPTNHYQSNHPPPPPPLDPATIAVANLAGSTIPTSSSSAQHNFIGQSNPHYYSSSHQHSPVGFSNIINPVQNSPYFPQQQHHYQQQQHGLVPSHIQHHHNQPHHQHPSLNGYI